MLFQAQIASASCDGKPAINLTDGNDPAQMQLSGKGSAVANLGMDVQIVFVLRPPEPVTGRIANRTVQRQCFACTANSFFMASIFCSRILVAEQPVGWLVLLDLGEAAHGRVKAVVGVVIVALADFAQ